MTFHQIEKHSEVYFIVSAHMEIIVKEGVPRKSYAFIVQRVNHTDIALQKIIKVKYWPRMVKYWPGW